MTLLTRGEIADLLIAEVGRDMFATGGTLPVRPGARAVLFLPSGPAILREKHLRACLDRADDHRYQVAGMAYDADAVLGLAEAGLVDAVVVAVRWRGSRLDEVATAAESLGVRVDVVREPPASTRRLSVTSLTVRLQALGLTAEDIADVLATPGTDVRRVGRASRNDQPMPRSGRVRAR